MIEIHRKSLMTFYGDKKNEISMQDIKQARLAPTLSHIADVMSLDNLIVLDQVHGAHGFVVEQEALSKKFCLFKQQGDFLVTSLKKCGLVVVTADCVPIILYDHLLHVAGIVHAGWRGAAQGVAVQALHAMLKIGCSIQNVEAIFAASAAPCCYEVSFNFVDEFAHYDYASEAFIKRNNKLYFDKKLFLRRQLERLGIQKNNIYNKNAACTICNKGYCSFRREKDQGGRQATVVALL